MKPTTRARNLPLSLAETPTGSLVVLGSSGRSLGLVNATRYEVGDGDLVVTSRQGRVLRIPAGDWFAVGRLARDRGLAWVKVERFAA